MPDCPAYIVRQLPLTDEYPGYVGVDMIQAGGGFSTTDQPWFDIGGKLLAKAEKIRFR